MLRGRRGLWVRGFLMGSIEVLGFFCILRFVSLGMYIFNPLSVSSFSSYGLVCVGTVYGVVDLI